MNIKMDIKKIKILSVFIVVLLFITSMNITASAAGVTIKKSHYSVQIGSTVNIEATGSGIVWSSSNTKVATVSQLGVVKGISMGTATITAKSGSSSATCEITVGFYKGIDVSSWNGDYTTGTYKPVDWAKVKAQGIDFAIIRAGYGWEDYPYQNDSQFVANVKGCVENDIPFGLYFYSYAYDNATALKEANYLLREINEYIPQYKDKITIPIAYDMEEDFVYTMDKTKLTNVALTFCNAIKAAGFDAMVYGNTATFNNMNLTTLQNNDIGFWYAMWPYTPDFSQPETIGQSNIIPDVWQYASDGTVPGAGTTNGVDMNVIYMLSTKTGVFKATSTTATVSSQGSGKASLKWNSVTDATYNLYRSELTSSGKIDSANVKFLYTGTKTSFTDTSMQYGKGYYYYTDTSFSGDFLDPSYRKIMSGSGNGAYVYNVYNGDVNLDGEIGLLDAILVQKNSLAMGSFTAVQKYAGDYDKSGTINLADAIAVMKRALNM